MSTAVIYILYELKLNLWLRSNPVSKFSLLRHTCCHYLPMIAFIPFVMIKYVLWWSITIMWSLNVFINDFAITLPANKVLSSISKSDRIV